MTSSLRSTLVLRYRSVRKATFLAALAAATIGCGTDSATAPETTNQELASVRLTANLNGTAINTLVITVTGAGIPVPLVYNLNSVSNVASGTLRLPAGLARTFNVQAFDSEGDVTHDGSVTTDVRHGQNDPINISLTPRNGHQPVVIHMGDFSVVVSPGSASIGVGGTAQLAAVVTAPNGDHPTPTVEWATADPSVATVDRGTGMVVGIRFGQVQIMATYGGVAGTMNLVVTDASAPLTISGPIYPAPGGNTFVPGTGDAGRGTGKLNMYSGFDLTATRYLAFGVDATSMPALKFNSTEGSTAIDAASRMTFDMENSDPGTGTIRYTGSTIVPLASGATMSVLTRFSLTLTTGTDALEDPAVLEGADDAGVPAAIGGVALITDAFAGTSTFRVRLLFEASTNAGTTWGPALDVFDAIPLKASTARARSSFTGAFYYSF